MIQSQQSFEITEQEMSMSKWLTHGLTSYITNHKLATKKIV